MKKINYFTIVFLALFWVYCNQTANVRVDSSETTAVEEQETQQETETIVEPVTRGAVAVMPFTADTEQDGLLFAGSLAATLQSQNRFTVVERARLNELLKEMANTETGLLNPENAAKIGQLVGARYLILGELGTQMNTLTASARVVHVETGAVIASSRRNGMHDQVIDHMSEALGNQLAIYMALDNPNSPYTIAIKLKDDRNRFRVGETMELKFKVISHSLSAARSVYIQIYAIDTKGTMTLIYPNRFSGQEPVFVDKEYSLPDDRAAWEWALVPPTGTEAIQAIVTDRPVDFLDVLSKTRFGFPSASQNGNLQSTYSAIVVRIKKEQLEGWSASRVSYELE